MIENQFISRQKGQKDVLKLASKPISIVRIGLIGLGVRASRALDRFMSLNGVEIKALCDISSQNVDQFQYRLLQKNRLRAKEYVGVDSWKRLCEDIEVDLIYICTDWLSHAKIAIYAMQQDKHVAVEVPAATTVEACWQLVDTAEKTRKHCMMLENCCYDYFELATLNMVQQGIFGEVLHGEGAYIHDLRERIFTNEFGARMSNNWQNNYNIQHTGNPYPTHGLGPVSQVLNIHRGDKMDYLVSMSSKQQGMAEYVKGKHPLQAEVGYKLGDMNTTLIKTHKGKTIMLQHNISNPRPYSRIHSITGTKGFYQKYPIEQIVLESEDNSLSSLQIKELLNKYKHPFYQEIGDLAIETCGERARDFIMDYRLIYCLQNGLPLDQDVYDAAEWSCIVELSEKSVLNNSMPVQIPDFTRGAWNKLKTLEFAK